MLKNEKQLSSSSNQSSPQLHNLGEAPPSQMPQKSQQVMGMMHVERTEIIKSPYPPPEMLAAYENVVKGSAERLITMAEREQNFQHKRNINAQNLQLAGLVFGFCLALVTMGGGVWIILAGYSWQGFCMVMGAGASLIGTAIWGQQSKTKIAMAKTSQTTPSSSQAPNQSTINQG